MSEPSTYLTIVKSTGDGEVVNVLVKHSSHLSLLNGTHTPLRVHDEDRDISLSSKTVNGSRASVTTGRTDNGQVVSIYSNEHLRCEKIWGEIGVAWYHWVTM